MNAYMIASGGVGYSQVELDSLAEEKTAVFSATLPGSSALILVIDRPYAWTAVARGFTVSYQLSGAATAQNLSYVFDRQILDGAGNVLRTIPVGAFTPRTLAELECGNTDRAAPACPEPIDFPVDLCVGSQAHGRLRIAMVNNAPLIADEISVQYRILIEPAVRGFCPPSDHSGKIDRMQQRSDCECG